MDLSGYGAYMEGRLSDYELPEHVLQKSVAVVDNLPKPQVKKTGKW